MQKSWSICLSLREEPLEMPHVKKKEKNNPKNFFSMKKTNVMTDESIICSRNRSIQASKRWEIYEG